VEEEACLWVCGRREGGSREWLSSSCTNLLPEALRAGATRECVCVRAWCGLGVPACLPVGELRWLWARGGREVPAHLDFALLGCVLCVWLGCGLW